MVDSLLLFVVERMTDTSPVLKTFPCRKLFPTLFAYSIFDNVLVIVARQRKDLYDDCLRSRNTFDATKSITNNMPLF